MVYDELDSIVSSLSIVLLGNLLGLVLGVVIALLLGKKNVIHYIIDLAKGIPNIVLFPLFITVFGIGNFSRIMIIFWASIFINIISAYKGMFFDIDNEIIEACQVDGMNRFQTMIYIRLPNAMISILYGVKNAIAVSFISIISIETLGAVKGIGYNIFYYYNVFNYNEMYKWIIIACSITLILNIFLDIIIKITRRKLYG